MFTLNRVVPAPLKESLVNPASDIWNTTCHFVPQRHYLVTAPSGKGKSTLLHALYRLRMDYDGTLVYQDRPLSKWKNEAWARVRQREISIVFQDLRLFLNLTGLENIVLKSSLQNTTPLPRIMAMAEQLGVAPYLHQLAATLSYGQRQRIAIIRALCQPFQYLLLDEPFSHLDAANIQLATELIQIACDQNGASIILVSLGEPYLFNYHFRYNM